MKKLSVILSLVLAVAVLFSSSVQAQEKKKVSPQAKGAILGTVVGAGTGILINKKKRAVGGVIGGVVGGGAGYAVGKSIDNKNKAKAAESARIAAVNRAAAAEREAANQRAENRRLVAIANSATTTKQVAVPAAVYSGYTAGVEQPQMMSLANMSYLPNQNYGDRSKPYSTSEYRRKSW